MTTVLATRPLTGPRPTVHDPLARGLPPPGVGMGFTPQVWLQPGDVMELGIDGLGSQRQNVLASR